MSIDIYGFKPGDLCRDENNDLFLVLRYLPRFRLEGGEIKPVYEVFFFPGSFRRIAGPVVRLVIRCHVLNFSTLVQRAEART